MIGNGSQTQIAVAVQAAFDTLPDAPAWSVFRATQSSLRSNKTTIVSDEIRADRNVSDLILAGCSASGELSGELSYGSWDSIFAAALMADWNADVLKNGTTPKYLAVEEKYELGAADAYARFIGCMVDSLNLSVTARETIKIKAALKARNEVTDDAILAGATYTPANSNPVQAAPRGVAALAIGTYSAKVKSLSLDLKNNLRDRPTINSLYSEEYGLGRCEVSGEMELYFSDGTVYADAIAHASAALTATLGSEAGEKYTLRLPKIILGDASKDTRSNSSDLMVKLPFQAVFDETAGASIVLTRAVA